MLNHRSSLGAPHAKRPDCSMLSRAPISGAIRFDSTLNSRRNLIRPFEEYLGRCERRLSLSFEGEAIAPDLTPTPENEETAVV